MEHSNATAIRASAPWLQYVKPPLDDMDLSDLLPEPKSLAQRPSTTQTLRIKVKKRQPTRRLCLKYPCLSPELDWPPPIAKYISRALDPTNRVRGFPKDMVHDILNKLLRSVIIRGASMWDVDLWDHFSLPQKLIAPKPEGARKSYRILERIAAYTYDKGFETAAADRRLLQYQYEECQEELTKSVSRCRNMYEAASCVAKLNLPCEPDVSKGKMSAALLRYTLRSFDPANHHPGTTRSLLESRLHVIIDRAHLLQPRPQDTDWDRFPTPNFFFKKQYERHNEYVNAGLNVPPEVSERHSSMTRMELDEQLRHIQLNSSMSNELERRIQIFERGYFALSETAAAQIAEVRRLSGTIESGLDGWRNGWFDWSLHQTAFWRLWGRVYFLDRWLEDFVARWRLRCRVGCDVLVRLSVTVEGAGIDCENTLDLLAMISHLSDRARGRFYEIAWVSSDAQKTRRQICAYVAELNIDLGGSRGR